MDEIEKMPYDSLPKEDSEADTDREFLETSTSLLGRPLFYSRGWLSSPWVIVLQAAMLLLTIVLAIVAVSFKPMAEKDCPKCYVDDEQCAQHMSAYCACLSTLI